MSKLGAIDWTWSNWIAAYAAVVATGALALEARRSFDSRVRLLIQSAINVQTAFDLAKPIPRLNLVVSIANIGVRPVTVTGLFFADYASYLKALRGIGQKYAPITRCDLPKLLMPGDRWTASVAQSEEVKQACKRGTFYVLVQCADQRRLRRARVAWVDPPAP